MAGMLFGCLLYKPQFALIIPPLLLATRNWRAVLGAVASSGALIGLTLQIWGWPVWQAFFDSLPLTRNVVIEQGSTGFHKIMSPFAAVRMWGGAIPFAYAVRAIATALAFVRHLGRLVRKSANVRNAAFARQSLVSTPYVLDYDYVVLLPASLSSGSMPRRTAAVGKSPRLRLDRAAASRGRSRNSPYCRSDSRRPCHFGIVRAEAARIGPPARSRHRHPAVHVKRLARHVTGFATGQIDQAAPISSPLPIAPSGMRDRMPPSAASFSASVIAEVMNPGATALTVIRGSRAPARPPWSCR